MECRRCNCSYWCIKVNEYVIEKYDMEGTGYIPYCKRYHAYLPIQAPKKCPKNRDHFEYIANTFCKGKDGIFFFIPVLKYIEDCMLYLEQEYRFFFYDNEPDKNKMAFIETRAYITSDLLDMGYIKKIEYPLGPKTSLKDLKIISTNLQY